MTATLAAALEEARQLLNTGQFAAAEAVCQAALAKAPNDAEAHFVSGVIASLSGQPDLAVARYERAIALQPQRVDYWHNLSAAYLTLQRNEEAIAMARRVLAICPELSESSTVLGHALLNLLRPSEAIEAYLRALPYRPHCIQTLVNLGCAYQAVGRHRDAEAVYRQALALPDAPAEAAANLGNALFAQKRYAEALDVYRRALEMRPGYINALNNLGSCLQRLGRNDEAEQCYRETIALDPNRAEAYNNLGTLCKEREDWPEAEAMLRRALTLDPRMADAWSNLGNVCSRLDRLDEALVAFGHSITVDPNYHDAYYNLGTALELRYRYDEAEAAFRDCLAIKPDHAWAHNNLGRTLQALGRVDEALVEMRCAVECDPTFALAAGNLLSVSQYLPGITLAELAERHREWDEQFAAPLARQAVRPTRRASISRLRIGFVSPDLGIHPVSTFLAGAVEAVDRRRCELVFYSDRDTIDPMTRRLQATAATWRNTRRLSNDRLAAVIADDQVDVLIDLAGHTANNRMLLFAMRPARLQLTWIGYEGSTGLRTIDGLIADRWIVPPEAESFYCERVLRMPDGYVVYDPPLHAPDVGAPPAVANGHATFGNFGNPAKLNIVVLDAWAEILRRAPNARLVLKYRHLDAPSMAKRLHDAFRQRDIDPARIDLRGWTPPVEFHQHYREIDIMLDTWPFGGGATTCDALWMGVPVVTLPGATFAGRHSVSYLTNIGLTETIARNVAHYVELAVAWADDLDRLAHTRRLLRDQMRQSPLCDGATFAGNWLDLLWRTWESV